MEQRPRRNHSYIHYDLGIGNNFIGVTLKAQVTKENINCACFFNCTSKNIIKKV